MNTFIWKRTVGHGHPNQPGTIREFPTRADIAAHGRSETCDQYAIRAIQDVRLPPLRLRTPKIAKVVSFVRGNVPITVDTSAEFAQDFDFKTQDRKGRMRLPLRKPQSRLCTDAYAWRGIATLPKDLGLV